MDFDLQTLCEQATEQARNLLRGGEYDDLADFTITTYTNEEFDDLDIPAEDREWMGQYVRNSIDSPHGLTVLLNLDKHAELADPQTEKEIVWGMRNTILHEVGHGLWELLDEESQARYEEAEERHEWGPEEAFADSFMFKVRGEAYLMHSQPLFEEITEKPNETKTQKG
jgi:hypothetical protein